MIPSPWLFGLRVALLVSLAASAALYVDYTTPLEAFCGSGSGCAKVRGSGFGYLFGGALPVPVVGLMGFGSVYVLTLFNGSPVARKLLPWLSITGGVIAALLIVAQLIVIKSTCWLCMVADAGAIAAAVIAYLGDRAGGSHTTLDEESSRKKRPEKESDTDVDRSDSDPRRAKSSRVGLEHATWAVVVAGLVAVAAPIAWPRLRPLPPIPPEIGSLYEPGKINVVEFFDFECPFCRRLHPTLKKVIKDYDGPRADGAGSPGDGTGQVRVLRKHFPLSFHENALPCAKAYVCVERQKPEKTAEFTDRLVESETIGASPARRIAADLGVDMKVYDRCLSEPETQAVIDKDVATLRAAGMSGLPTTYIGNRRLVGAQPEPVIREAFEAAREELKGGDAESGIPGPWYLLLTLGTLVGVGVFGRQRASDSDTATS